MEQMILTSPLATKRSQDNKSDKSSLTQRGERRHTNYRIQRKQRHTQVMFELSEYMRYVAPFPACSNHNRHWLAESSLATRTNGPLGTWALIIDRKAGRKTGQIVLHISDGGIQ